MEPTERDPFLGKLDDMMTDYLRLIELYGSPKLLEESRTYLSDFAEWVHNNNK